MHMRRTWGGGVLLSLIFGLLLTGCGSGGGDEVVPVAGTSAPEGIYSGTSGNGRTMWGTVLNDGSYWFLYSAIGDPTFVGGVIQGTGQFSQDTFASVDTHDFSDFGSLLEAVISGSYERKVSLTGNMTVNTGGGTTFNLNYSTASEATPNLALLAGTYPGGSAEEGSVQTPHHILVDGNGGLRIVRPSSPGVLFMYNGWTIVPCQMTGTIEPRAVGHVYDLTLYEGCTLNGQPQGPYPGIAVFDPVTNRLGLIAISKDRQKVFLYDGVKP